MYYNNFKECKLSGLGFGTMRLPLLEDGSIDQQQVEKMTDYALAQGINYFDTAWPYHNRQSEIAIGKALKKHPRESFYLATKYPGHQLSSSFDPAAIFEKQLEKCQVDYFDFYLLHNLTEFCIDVYMDPQWGIVDYFLKQKELGRIKHLGFSTHARPETMKAFLEYCGDKMEFCQIQLNYLDYTLQNAKEKLELLDAYHIPVWVMEPLRGGRLVNLKEHEQAFLSEKLPGQSPVDLAFRFLQGQPQLGMILSGMSNMEQMADNIAIFEERHPLNPEETEALLEVAESMKNDLPCTGCRYCCEGCPMGLDIPMLIKVLNQVRFAQSGFSIQMQMEALPEDKQASACLGCGACTHACPQHIDVPKAMRDLVDILSRMPKWKDTCLQREAEARKMETEEKKA